MNKNIKIAVHAYKFNGWLYRSWEFPNVIEETDEYICLHSSGSRVITADKKKSDVFHHSVIRFPTIWYFYKKKWFNIIVTCKNNNFEFYVNIATPFIVEEETLKYIDLDLDFRINGINPGTIKKLDLHEYDENKLKYNYPIEIMKQIEIAEQEIIEMFKTSKFRDLIKLDFAQNKDKE